MSCTVFNESGRILPMEKFDSNKAPSRIKCERDPDKKTECRNYCACGMMSKCTAGSSWRAHRECKFSRKSSSGDHCMYYRDTINGHCDCVIAHRELKPTNNRWCGDFLPYKPGASHPAANAPFKALKCFCLFGHRSKIQATRLTGGRWLSQFQTDTSVITLNSKRKRGLDLPMEFSVRTHHKRKGKIKISSSYETICRNKAENKRDGN